MTGARHERRRHAPPVYGRSGLHPEHSRAAGMPGDDTARRALRLNHSGGKDSQAMTILLARIVPRQNLLAVHTPLGEVEWPGTIEHIEATIPGGVPLVFAPIASGKTLLDRIEERGRFPSASVRWCTSDFKRSPIERELRRYLKAHPRFGGRVVNCMGHRADESAARAGGTPGHATPATARRAGSGWTGFPSMPSRPPTCSGSSATPASRRTGPMRPA